MDLIPLSVAPKILPPKDVQLPNESLRYWSGVTEAITARQFNRATALKQEIEERQREKAKKREEMGDGVATALLHRCRHAAGQARVDRRGEGGPEEPARGQLGSGRERDHGVLEVLVFMHGEGGCALHRWRGCDREPLLGQRGPDGRVGTLVLRRIWHVQARSAQRSFRFDSSSRRSGPVRGLYLKIETRVSSGAGIQA